MKYILLFMFAWATLSNAASAQIKDPWNSSQLMAPKDLAADILARQTNHLVILSVGPGALIKGSVDIGPVHEPDNLQKLKDYLKKVNKDQQVVIYCGCCPFAKCPNIKPAFQTLTAMGFKNAKLLDLPHNIKTDWLDKNYPTQK